MFYGDRIYNYEPGEGI